MFTRTQAICVVLLFYCFILYFSYTKPIDGDDDITFDFTSPQKERIFIARHKHYLGNGLYLWRYRVNKEVQQLSIAMKYKGEHLGSSPYLLGDVIMERCECPSRTLEQWLTDNGCQVHYEQIENDLKPYKDGIMLEGLYERLVKEFPRSHGVHYSIVNNKVRVK